MQLNKYDLIIAYQYNITLYIVYYSIVTIII